MHPTPKITWYTAETKTGAWEDKSLAGIIGKIVAWYAEDIYHREESCPEVVSIMDYSNDDQRQMTASEVSAFNDKLDEAMDKAVFDMGCELSHIREISSLHGRV